MSLFTACELTPGDITLHGVVDRTADMFVHTSLYVSYESVRVICHTEIGLALEQGLPPSTSSKSGRC